MGRPIPAPRQDDHAHDDRAHDDHAHGEPAHAETQALMWLRTDVPGSEVAFVEAERGIRAHGSQHAIDPVPYVLTYELVADDALRAQRLTAHTEGAGWTRDLRLTRTNDGWTCSTASTGEPALAAFDGGRIRPAAPPGAAEVDSLRGVLDVDLGGSPLTNALPVRRLGLLEAPAGSTAGLSTAWVLPPTLEVVAARQTYVAVAPGRVRFGDAATDTVVRFAPDGWVADYPGLARRVAAPGE